MKYSRPFLLAAVDRGRDQVLSLFNKRGGVSYLGESGAPEWDAFFTEHNGLLRDRASAVAPEEALPHLLRFAPVVVLSGVDRAHARAARSSGWVRVRAERFAPAAHLAGAAPYRETLSASFRAELRRAERETGGEPVVERAVTVENATEFFDELIRLHNRRWAERGGGAFASETLRRFHTELIARGVARGEVDLLRVCAGGRRLGLLYNFRYGSRAYNYQGGFEPPRSARDKPGLLCHAAAASWYRNRNVSVYDLLAGDQPYKRRLAPHGGETLYWLTVARRWSPRAALLLLTKTV